MRSSVVFFCYAIMLLGLLTLTLGGKASLESQYNCAVMKMDFWGGGIIEPPAGNPDWTEGSENCNEAIFTCTAPETCTPKDAGTRTFPDDPDYVGTLYVCLCSSAAPNEDTPCFGGSLQGERNGELYSYLYCEGGCSGTSQCMWKQVSGTMGMGQVKCSCQ